MIAYHDDEPEGRAMTLFFHLAIFFVLWWLVLFIVLATGVHSQQDAGEVVKGTVSSAPARHRAVRTILLATAATAVLYGLWLAASHFFGVTFQTVLDLFPDPPTGYDT